MSKAAMPHFIMDRVGSHSKLGLSRIESYTCYVLLGPDLMGADKVRIESNKGDGVAFGDF